MDRRSFLSGIIYLPLILSATVGKSCPTEDSSASSLTKGESTLSCTTIACIDEGGCVAPGPVGEVGQVLTQLSPFLIGWDDADNQTVTPPTGFTSTTIATLFAELAAKAFGPRAHLRGGGLISPSAGVVTSLQSLLDTISFDSVGGMASVGGTITIPSNGYYDILARATVQLGALNEGIALMLYRASDNVQWEPQGTPRSHSSTVFAATFTIPGLQCFAGQVYTLRCITPQSGLGVTSADLQFVFVHP